MIHVHTECSKCGEPTNDRHALAVARAERSLLHRTLRYRNGKVNWYSVLDACDVLMKARARAKQGARKP